MTELIGGLIPVIAQYYKLMQRCETNCILAPPQGTRSEGPIYSHNQS